MTHFELWRQDDNGNEFPIATFSSFEDAEKERLDFEARGHKQHYWVRQAEAVSSQSSGFTDEAKT